jgi:ATP-dependent Lhr-like helicase
VRFTVGFDLAALRAAAETATTALPSISSDAVEGLKFSAALPSGLARATLAERFADHEHALEIAGSPVLFLYS